MKYLSLMLLFFLHGCHQSNVDSKNLSEKYSIESINYFYEIAFKEDYNPTPHNIIKWKEDVLIFVLGSPDSSHIRYLNSSIKEINLLGLPINLKIVSEIAKSNLKIFIDLESNLPKEFNINNKTGGIGLIQSKNGEVLDAKIAIVKDFKSDNPNYNIGLTILEELVQILGVTGDSYTYPSSIFYQGRNSKKYFTNIDKEVLKMLYDSHIPLNYSRESYRKEFERLLYSQKTTQKLLSVINESHIPADELIMIKEYCFIDGHYCKYPTEIILSISGDYTERDSILIQDIISCFNNVHPNINLLMRNNRGSNVDNEIFFNFKINENIERDVTISNKLICSSDKEFSLRLKNEVELRYKLKPDIDLKKRRAIEVVLYECIGPIGLSEENKIFQDTVPLALKSKFSSILRLMYNNAFSNGYSLSEYSCLIENIIDDEDTYSSFNYRR